MNHYLLNNMTLDWGFEMLVLNVVRTGVILDFTSAEILDS